MFPKNLIDRRDARRRRTLRVLIAVALLGPYPGVAAVGDPATTQAAAELRQAEKAWQSGVRFLEQRVKGDPDDIVAWNSLGARYLQRLRQTGSLDYLQLASRAAKASLAVIPEDLNQDALAVRARVEYESHDFAAARDSAARLIELAPDKVAGYQTLGDALLELGDYDKAAATYETLRRMDDVSIGTETRLARLALLHGHVEEARAHLVDALAAAMRLPVPSPETLAWCHWQLGDVAFSAGDYEAAERSQRDALAVFPSYYRALASLGRALAARGDLAGATAEYEHAVRVLPDPTFVAALGDLYKLAGRDKEAAAQYLLVEQIGRLSAFNGVLYNRQLANFYADHGLKAQEAYAGAVREYAVRHDVYGADSLAWTALKAGRPAEAKEAMTAALRLGTRDARLLYHAGLVSLAAGDRAGAQKSLEAALALNPQFDPLQAPLAREALRSLARGAGREDGRP